jgi:hypothetical protein
MGQVPRQLDGQGVDGVPQPLMAVVVVGERVVDGGKQRVDAAVLILHRLQQCDVVGTAGQVGPHPRPQVVVLGSVMVVQLGLEQLPTGENSASPGWVLQIGVMAAGGAAKWDRSRRNASCIANMIVRSICPALRMATGSSLAMTIPVSGAGCRWLLLASMITSRLGVSCWPAARGSIIVGICISACIHLK